jgi:uncharacterized protein YtpQ (UPF0354 family)
VKVDEVITFALPQFFPAHWLDRPGLVFSDFPSRIRVGYVVRGDGNYSYLCDEEFSALSIPLEDLHAAALTNLAQLPSANISIGKVPGGAEGWISATDDNFAAVRILLPKVQEVFRQQIGEEFLISIPDRDDCFCWSPAQPAERQEKHARDALAAFVQEQYKLTPDILVCSQGSFRLHREQVVGEPNAAADGGRNAGS